ncbi:hypothetical protein NC651_031663 [Populus alba x Populus x berolinensis]|nr:hypothetical protein NC651_031663 [Populus alba x Populus x berolinensis]
MVYHVLASCFDIKVRSIPYFFPHALTTVWVLLWKFFSHSLDRWLEILTESSTLAKR